MGLTCNSNSLEHDCSSVTLTVPGPASLSLHGLPCPAFMFASCPRPRYTKYQLFQIEQFAASHASFGWYLRRIRSHTPLRLHFPRLCGLLSRHLRTCSESCVVLSFESLRIPHLFYSSRKFIQLIMARIFSPYFYAHTILRSHSMPSTHHPSLLLTSLPDIILSQAYPGLTHAVGDRCLWWKRGMLGYVCLLAAEDTSLSERRYLPVDFYSIIL